MANRKNANIKIGDRQIITSIDSCLYCGSQENLTIEHIIPLSKGGTSEICNLTRACIHCNSMKSTYSIEEWTGRVYEKINYHLSEADRFKKILRNLNRGWYRKFHKNG